jgi:hypothetical protein
MNAFFKQTKNYQIQLKGDLLMVKDSEGDLLKAAIVPVWEAVESFNKMVNRINEIESSIKIIS